MAVNNKWVFDGIGALIIMAIITATWARLKHQSQQGEGVSQQQRTGKGCVNTQIAGDLTVGDKGGDPDARR